jgi:transposase-like protein
MRAVPLIVTVRRRRLTVRRRVRQDGRVKRRSSQIRPTRRHRTPEEKAEILRAHQRSGLSLLAFAGKHGLCYASLLRWRCQPRKGASVLAPPDTEADPGFIPVKLEGEVLGGDYVLSWTGGHSLKIPRQFEADSLRRLLRVLEGVR